MALGSLAPIDRAALLYAGIAVVLAIGRSPGGPPPGVLAAPALLALIAARLAPRARKAGPGGRFLAEFYPLLLAPALYTQIGLVNSAAGVSHDATVRGWEHAVFGGQPALEWIRAWPGSALSWAMHLGYLSYYFILAGAPAALWFTGRREAARRTLFLMTTTFYFCYTVFLLFPVAGPRYLFPLPQNAATSVPIAVFTHRLVESGSAWGTAFPSSHVAVGFVTAICAARAWPALGAVLLPASVLLALGTVYGQFHYGVDALAGTAVAAVALVLGCRRPSA